MGKRGRRINNYDKSPETVDDSKVVSKVPLKKNHVYERKITDEIFDIMENYCGIHYGIKYLRSNFLLKTALSILQKCKNGKLKYRTKRIKEEEEVVYDFADNIISTILSEVTYPEITEEDKLLVLHYYVYTINKEIGRYYIKPISMKRHRQLIN
jgi:hypothetical protein